MLHQINQRCRQCGGAWPFPRRKFEHEERVGVQLYQVASEDLGNVLDKNGACAVDPVGCYKDVNAAEADDGFSCGR
jgi:hypothetical protein